MDSKDRPDKERAMRVRRARSVREMCISLGVLGVLCVPLLAQPATSQLSITGAVADPTGETITITGLNFGTGRPFVTLDMVPLPIRIARDTEIVAEAPTRIIPPGEYLVTVSRGASAADNGSFLVTIGSAGAPPPPSAPESRVTSTVLSATGSEPAARVGDRVVTVAEVDREWQRTDASSYLGLSRRVYELRRRVTDAITTDELLAREASARGVTTDALLKEEIPKRIVPLPESAVVSLYQSLGDTTRGATLDQMRPAIRSWLAKNTEPELARMTYIEELKKVSTRADILLVAPRVRVERSAQDAALGPASAAVEIVAFADFQSAEYARLASAFRAVRDTFGDRVRVVFKHLPALGPDSVRVAHAAQCANAQGRFWPYHDALLAQPGTPTERMKQAMGAAALDAAAFAACIDGDASRDVIRQATDEAARYDVQSSPSFLVNGRLAPDSPPFLQPFDYFKRLVEEELSEQAKSARPGAR
jgi:protein-disulfide isomerase